MRKIPHPILCSDSPKTFFQPRAGGVDIDSIERRIKSGVVDIFASRTFLACLLCSSLYVE